MGIYRPLIVRLALRTGLQPSDADDVAQRVLMSVSRAIGDWEKDPARGSFRSWLRTVARNAIINMMQRGPRDAALGGSEFLDACHAVESTPAELERLIDDEHDRCLLRAAAARDAIERSSRGWLRSARPCSGSRWRRH